MFKNLISDIWYLILLVVLVAERLNGYFFVYQIGKFTSVTRSFYQVIVYPMVITAAWFPE